MSRNGGTQRLQCAWLQFIIGVEQQGVAPAGLSQAAVPCRSSAGVGLVDHQQPRVKRGVAGQQPGCVVRRAIIDDDQFYPRCPLYEDRLQGSWQQVGVVVGRDNDADQRSFCLSHSLPRSFVPVPAVRWP